MQTTIVNKVYTACYDLLVPRILVVEDDPRTAESIKLYLEHDGFEARLAADDYVTKPFSPLLDTQEPS